MSIPKFGIIKCNWFYFAFLELSEDLIKACANGETAKAKGLIEAGANPNYQEKYYHNQTPLHYAAEGNEVELIQLLIECGSSTTLKSTARPGKSDALYHAQTWGSKNREIINLLRNKKEWYEIKYW